MAHAVTFGDQIFPLTAKPPELGSVVDVPGAGVRVLYVSPSLERWPVAAAQEFAVAVRRFCNTPALLVCSADFEPIADAWASRSGWGTVRFDEVMFKSLGLWLPTLSLPARALLIVDASARLQFCQIATRLEDEIAFDQALIPLRNLG